MGDNTGPLDNATAGASQPAALEPKPGGRDRRRAERWKVLYNARLWSGFFVADCMVFDLSGTGAKLRLDDDGYCPQAFKLKFRDTPERDCRMVWREPKYIGVEFVAA